MRSRIRWGTARCRTPQLALLVLLGVEPCRAQSPDPAQLAAGGTPAGNTPASEPSGSSDGAYPAELARFLLEQAKERFNRGVANHDRDALESALDLLQLGRNLTGDPAFDFNAARVARELGRCGEASAGYQRFIARDPDADRRRRAEQRLAELHCASDAALATVEVLPGETLDVRLAAPGHGLRPPALRWDELAADPAAQSSSSTPPLLWGVVGAAGVSAALSVAFLAQAGMRDSQLAHLQASDEGKVAQLQSDGRAAQARARIFGVLAAGLGVGAAIGFWWSSRADAVESGLLVQASEAGASASWVRRF